MEKNVLAEKNKYPKIAPDPSVFFAKEMGMLALMTQSPSFTLPW